MWGTDAFAGTLPRVDERQLEPMNAQRAHNCWLSRRTVRPIPELVQVVAGVAANVRTIYRFSENQWFAWTTDVDAIASPVAQDSIRRTMWTGDGPPRMTGTTIMGGFVGPGKPISRLLGIPAPDMAPLVQVTGDAPAGDATAASATIGGIRFTANEAGTAANGVRITLATNGDPAVTWTAASRQYTVTYSAGDTVADVVGQFNAAVGGSGGPSVTAAVDTAGNAAPATGQLGNGTAAAEAEKEFHNWVYTYVSDLGEEGPPSNPSRTVERAYLDDGTVQAATLSGLDTGVTGAYGLALKRIYRTVTGTRGNTSYQLLAEIPLAQDTYVDTSPGSALAGDLVSADWDPPPENLEGLISFANGMAVGFVGRDVYFSEPFQPHAWPRDYVQPVESDIVRLGAFGNTLVIGTTGRPYIGSGTHPSNIRLGRMELDQACIAKHSMVRAADQGIIYASPDGLVRVGPNGARLVSREAYDSDGWEALGPENLRAVYHDTQYLGFLADSAIALDPENAGVVTFADDIDCAFVDREADRVYVASNGAIREWRAGARGNEALRRFVWRGRIETGPLRSFVAGQVIAKGYPVTLRLFVEPDPPEDGQPEPDPEDRVMVFEAAVANRRAFRLPPLSLKGEWELELEGAAEVREVRLGDMSEMLG